mgnify:CR=1 FL=1
MQESLGISISNRVIKYAKVTKNNDLLDVASFGVKFYDNLEKDLQQIISETNSKNIPICIDTQNEKVNYFSIFSLLSKADTKKTIGTEYETLCADNHMNPNAYEGRYLIVNDVNNKDRNRVIYFTESKTDLEERTAWLGNQRVSSMSPLPTSLCNIVETKKGENIMIVNIEEKTTVTTILNQRIYSIDTISSGMGEVLEKINEKENSYSKSYEACKNTTIYTMETTTTDDPNNKYLSLIVPTLFNIVQEVKKIKDIYARVDKIYLTGLGTVINNIDLYFQEYFQDSKCEILKPFFAENNSKINIKDYIEVNSAIALALNGMDYGFKDLNFKATNWKDDLNALLHSDIKTLRKESKGKKISFNFDTNMSGPLKPTEIWLVRCCVTVLMIVIIYSVCSILLGNQLSDKTAQAQSVIDDTTAQINILNSNESNINRKIADFERVTTNLQNASSSIALKQGRKNEIPTLLNQIVYTIPKNVQLTSIKNTEIEVDGETKQHILISAQSRQYEQLAYFKAKLSNSGYLLNVTSTEGTKTGEYVVVTIEGDLP